MADSQGTVTSMSGVTGILADRYEFCDAFTYTVDKVLLPAAGYASTPTTYISGLCASPRVADSSLLVPYILARYPKPMRFAQLFAGLP